MRMSCVELKNKVWVSASEFKYHLAVVGTVKCPNDSCDYY